MIEAANIALKSAAEPFDAIAQLLHPISPQDFLAEYWGKKPLHITGNSTRFSKVFDRRRFDAAIARAHAAGNDETFAVCCFAQDFDGAWTCSEAIEPNQVKSLVAANRTICVRNIASGDDELVKFGKRFASRMGLMGNVGFNAYLSGNASGADMHFDRSITCALQLEGRKRWRFARTAAVPWPPGNGRMQADGTPIYAAPWFGHNGWDAIPREQVKTEEVVLEQGDWLILPAGTWHDAKAIGHSFALNMMFSPWPLDNILHAALRQHFEGQLAWRGGVPGDVGVGEGRQARLGEYLVERIEDLRTALDDPQLQDRLVEACAAFADNNSTEE